MFYARDFAKCGPAHISWINPYDRYLMVPTSRETMSGRRRMIGAIGATAAMASMTLVAAAGSANASTSGNVPLTGSVPAFALHFKPTGTVAGSTKVTIQVWLKPR